MRKRRVQPTHTTPHTHAHARTHTTHTYPPILGKLDKSVDTADVHYSRMVPFARRDVH